MNPYRQLRLDRGLSLVQMSHALRVNVSSLQALEAGAAPKPYSTVEKALAEIMGNEAVQTLRTEYLAWREREGAPLRQKLLQVAK